MKSNSCLNVNDLLIKHTELLSSDNDNRKSDDNLFQTETLIKRKSNFFS